VDHPSSEEDVVPEQGTPEEQIVLLQRSLFTELYLSIFMLFARFGAEDSIGGTPFNGVGGITFVQGFLGASVFTWAEILAGRRGFIERYVVLILLVFIGLYFVLAYPVGSRPRPSLLVRLPHLLEAQANRPALGRGRHRRRHCAHLLRRRCHLSSRLRHRSLLRLLTATRTRRV
jgi:hypothetical protein